MASYDTVPASPRRPARRAPAGVPEAGRFPGGGGGAWPGCSAGAGSPGCPAPAPKASRSPSSPRRTVPVKMSSRSSRPPPHLGNDGRPGRRRGGPAGTPPGARRWMPECLLRRSRRRRTPHRPRRRTRRRAPCRCGLAWLAAGREGGDRVARSPAHHLNPEEGGELVGPGPLGRVAQRCRGRRGRRPGIGTAVDGQRFRLTRLACRSKRDRPGSSSMGRVSITRQPPCR